MALFNTFTASSDSASSSSSLKVLTLDDIKQIRLSMEGQKKFVEAHNQWLDELITMSEEDETVMSFFESGTFGSDTYDRLKKTRDASKDYYESVFTGEKSLYSQTLVFCDKHESLLNSSIGNQNATTPLYTTPGHRPQEMDR